MNDTDRQTSTPSGQIARRGRAEVAGGSNAVQRNGCAMSDSRVIGNPMLLIPKGAVTDAVSALWMANAHLFPTSMALATTFRLYLDQHGLTESEVVEICQRLLKPERRAAHKFASDLMTDLSALVVECVRRRQAERESDRRRQQDEDAGPVRLLVQGLKASIGRQPDECDFID